MESFFDALGVQDPVTRIAEPRYFLFHLNSPFDIKFHFPTTLSHPLVKFSPILQKKHKTHINLTKILEN